MNFKSTTTKQNGPTEDNDIFEDSSFLDKFTDCTFGDTTARSCLNTSILNRSGLNVSALCCDEEISGYDKITGKTWIYPTNYPVRDYQFNIIRAALLKNTLVSLPTGLGKTFIAAVVMYNFYRWYPLGKIVFTAPTRPLVAQQIDACYDIIAIPPDDTIEMTGHMQANTRKEHWKNKRVFFATPQVIYNDIQSGICPSGLIRCLVIDEAHRARGNYAYCQIVGTLTDMGHKTYRVLALSATPGSKVEDVINVVKHLQIAHLELRTENCIDVAPYSHSRNINTVVIQLGPQLTQLRNHYVEILDGYARRLKQLNILPNNLGNLSKGRIVMLYKEYQTKERGQRHPQHNYIMKDFTLLIALYHGLELLTKHGSRVFLNFFDEHPEKTWIQADDRLTGLLERLRDDLGINPLSLDRSILPDGTVPELPQNLCFGHPKFDKLKELMMEHFKKSKANGQDTRAIVFCEYRESVNLVHCLLLQCRPLIVPQMFVGQGASGKDGKTVISQKQQLRVMRNFRSGSCNVLVATCVAEEGLDVGSVDLIVCFDISTRSPVRLVQRCGRTGRERGGQVHILVTEGREHQTLLDCMRQRDGLNRKILQSRDVQNNLYALNPRMMPRGLVPECQKMYITANKRPDKDKGKDAKNAKGQTDLRKMFSSRASTSGATTSKSGNTNTLVSKLEFEEMFPEGFNLHDSYFEERKEYFAMSYESFEKLRQSEESSKLSTWLEWQRSLQKTVNVGHSKDTEILSSLLQYGDAKRFDLPTHTQVPVISTQEEVNVRLVPIPSPVKVSKPAPKKKQKAPPIQDGTRKDGDIRALFSTATKSTKNYTKAISELGIKNDGSIPTSLIDLLVDLSVENTTNIKCLVCDHLCDCKFLANLRENRIKPKFNLDFLQNPTYPDIDLVDDIKADDFAQCIANTNTDVQKLAEVGETIANISRNFDLEFDFDTLDTLDRDERKSNDNIGTEIVEEIMDSNDDKIEDKNFDLGDIEDIFDDSSPEVVEVKKNEIKENKNSSDPKQALEFFGLDSIDDIFADSDSGDNIQVSPELKPATNTQEQEISNAMSKESMNNHKPISLDCPRSPSILSGVIKQNVEPTSPILCSQPRRFQLSTNKSQPQSSTPIIIKSKQLFQEPSTSFSFNEHFNKTLLDQKQPNESRANNSKVNESNNKSMFTITQLVDMINKTDDGVVKTVYSITKEEEKLLAEIQNEEDRSASPILLTQAEKKKSPIVSSKNKTTVSAKKNESLIILESDSDSEDSKDATIIYEFDKNQNTPNKSNENPLLERSPLKRKFEEDELSSSPFFSKRQKLDKCNMKPLSLQEKIIAALNSNDVQEKAIAKDNDRSIHFVSFECQSQSILEQKENVSPLKGINQSPIKNPVSSFNKLQMFKREPNKYRLNRSASEKISSNINLRRNATFSDSDDDFVADDKKIVSQRNKRESKENSLVNHKMRKKSKRRAANEFLDLSAEQSDSASADELSDDSVGSIIDFICDENLEHDDREDMYAHYVKSVKSPVNGRFKIPQLPSRYKKEEILSQYVEEDSYEMDSFCVDSHIGLTQVNDVTELELAEQQLEKRRKARRKRSTANLNTTCDTTNEDKDSPIVRRVNRIAKRKISSDSDSN